MNEKLIKFVERMIEPKTKKIINSTELFEIFESMDVLDDDELINDVIDYFDSKKIEIDFRGKNNRKHQPRYERARMNAKMMKSLKINKEHISSIMKKTNSVNPEKLSQLRTKYFSNNKLQ